MVKKVELEAAERAFKYYITHPKSNWKDVCEALGYEIHFLTLFNAIRKLGLLGVNELNEQCKKCKKVKPINEFAFQSFDVQRKPMCDKCYSKQPRNEKAAIRKSQGLAWNEKLNKLWLKRWSILIKKEKK